MSFVLITGGAGYIGSHICKVFYDGVKRKGTLTRCEDGAIDFYKVFSKRYIN